MFLSNNTGLAVNNYKMREFDYQVYSKRYYTIVLFKSNEPSVIINSLHSLFQFIEFSDDEEERRFKAKKRNKNKGGGGDCETEGKRRPQAQKQNDHQR